MELWVKDNTLQLVLKDKSFKSVVISYNGKEQCQRSTLVKIFLHVYGKEICKFGKKFMIFNITFAIY